MLAVFNVHIINFKVNNSYVYLFMFQCFFNLHYTGKGIKQ